MTWWDDISRRILALAAMTLAVGIGLVVWGTASLIRHRTTASQTLGVAPAVKVSTAAFAQPKHYPCPIPGDFKPVDIPVGLLCDYYEHGIEHAPPRDPSGVMQKRERFYAGPHDPFELLESAAAPDPAGAAFASALAGFRSRWEVGKPTDQKQLESLERLASKSSLKSDVLIEAGRAINWLCGDEIAVAFFRAGLFKARAEYANVPAGDPISPPLLHALDQTKALWHLNAWSALEQRFRLANALNPPLSAEQRRAHYLVADMLYSQCRYEDAVKEITEVAAEHESAGDLGALERSDIPEMHWTRGLFLIAGGWVEDAISQFDLCATSDGPHQFDARRLAVLAAISANRLDDAVQRVKKLPLAAPPDALNNSIRIELAARMKRRASRQAQ